MTTALGADRSRSGRLLAWLADGNPVSRRAAALTDALRHRPATSGWAAAWGTVSIACLAVLTVTGLLLSLVYTPSSAVAPYAGSYAPLRGVAVSGAYASTLRLSLDVPGGLLVRQAHHWAALVLPGALLLQLASTFFGGGFRRPRRWSWVLLVGVLVLVLAAGWSGYALPDDDLSGTGLRIVEGTTLALPVVGTWLASALSGGEFPGRIVEHLYLVHLLVLAPLLVLLLLRARLAWRHGPPRPAPVPEARRRAAVLPLWPQGVVRAGGLGFATAGVLVLMAGTLTVSPVWLYGPSSPAAAYAGSQPDWYTAFLDGALRLVPTGWEVSVAGRTWTLAVLVPLAAVGLFFALLTLWPFVEERVSGRHGDRAVLERARDTPLRTGVGAAGITFYGALWLAGSADVLATQLRMSFEGVIVVLRVVVLVGPPLALWLTRTVCRTLLDAERERRRDGAESGVLVRLPSGGYVETHVPLPPPPPPPAALPAPAVPLGVGATR